MDTNTLAKDKGGKRHVDPPSKSKNGVDKRGHCEPEKAGERPGYQSRNYKNWRYKRRGWHTAPRSRHRIDRYTEC
eukprot:4435450-Heterocapsa_arctica.AAC.1